jgi:hypothetical protein
MKITYDCNPKELQDQAFPLKKNQTPLLELSNPDLRASEAKGQSHKQTVIS